MKFLIIGQTPPPYGGQSINIQKMVDILSKNGFDYKLLRMNFSEEMDEHGKLTFLKIWKLFVTIISLIKNLIVYRPNYIYYPPAGPEIIPMFRDIILLIWIRLLGFKLIFHFHAGGISNIYPTLSKPIKAIFWFAYGRPTHSICFSNRGKIDPLFLCCNNIHIIPSGVDDIKGKKDGRLEDNFIVLFAGVCRESKGIIDFINTIKIANKTNKKIIGRIIGKKFSEKESLAIDDAVQSGFVIYDGIKTGTAKNQIFSQSNVFLFPTFFEHENFPTVIIEAFSASLPVISTNWRGIADQITNGYNGYLFEIHAIEKMAESIILLANSASLYSQLSENSRTSYVENYSLINFEKNIVEFFKSLK